MKDRKEKCNHLIALEMTHDGANEIYADDFKESFEQRKKDKISWPNHPQLWQKEFKDLKDLIKQSEWSDEDDFVAFKYCPFCGKKLDE